MIAYKVVRLRRVNGVWKFLSSSSFGSAVIQYEVNRKVEVPVFCARAGCFPLLFESVTTTLDFCAAIYNGTFFTSHDGDFVVMECEVGNEVTPVPVDTYSLGLGKIVKSQGNYSFPDGTVSFRDVYPIRATELIEFIKTHYISDYITNPRPEWNTRSVWPIFLGHSGGFSISRIPKEGHYELVDYGEKWVVLGRCGK